MKNPLHFILSTNYIFIVERSFHSKTALYDVISRNHSSWPSLNSSSRKKKKKNRKTSEGWPPIRIRTSIRPRDKISTTKSHMIETPKRASSSFLVKLSFKSTNTNQLHCLTSRPLRIIGTLRSNDADDGENVKKKKTVGLVSKTTTLQVHHTFLYIFFPFLHDYDVKMPNFAFYRGRKQPTTKFYFFFWAWIWSLEIQLQEGSPTIDKVSG